MKRLILSAFFGVSALFSFAQDTTWVQTYTFDTITTRRANFQFPASLDNKRFEKVLMYYKLKCSPLTTWDQYNCGEWDYLTYTRIFDHTNVWDSVKVEGPKFKVNTQTPASYAYANQVYFDQQYRLVSRRTAQTPNMHAVSGSAASTVDFVRTGSNGAKMQWIVSAADLAANGVTAGNIQALQLMFSQGLSELENVTIRIKSTSLSALTTWETTGFTSVFNDDVANSVNGANVFHFSAPFSYNGTDNLVIEVTYEDAHLASTTSALSMQTLGTNKSLFYDNASGVFRATGSNFADVNLSNVDLGADVTVAFWTKGNGNSGTNTSILEALDSLGNRVFNIHMPWSDNTIYFDAGSGSGYDRISKLATASDIDNVWHHWAFVKKSSTGQMFIYRDGVVWHSGTGKTKPVGKIAKFILGANAFEGNFFKGDIDEFSVWSTAINAADITSWMNKKITATHPNYADLELYYDFDGERACVDRSTHNRLAMASTAASVVSSNTGTLAGTVSSNEIPVFSLDQGTYNAASQDSVLTALFPAVSVKFNYAASDNNFVVASNQKTYTQGTIDTLSSTGSNLGSGPSAVDATELNDTIFYYQEPFELVNDVEIGRYITPYGIGFDLGPQGFTWIYDVTDYQKYLHGMVDLAAHNTQELIDLKFAFVEGIPARDVHNIEPIWKNWTSYNYAEMANDVVLQAKQVILSDTSQNFKIRTRLTGHGQVGAGACCEWQDKQHKIIIDGVERFSWSIWRDDCGKNPNTAQGGTWPYAREGWCPGDMVREFDHELSSFVQPGDTLSVDYDISDVPTSDPDQAGGNFITAIDLVSYSAPNFQHDAAILDILNPNSYEYYKKWNPTCSNPRVILQNNGALPLTACKIRIWVTYGNFVDYNWTGNLGFLQKEIVEIPIADQHFWLGANPTNGFYARVIEIDGSSSLDEYANNNEFKTKYTAPEVIDGPFYVWMVTNNKASENKWRLVDQNGNTLFERTSLANSTDYKDTFNLAPGCYSLILEDSDNDGLSFWYSAQTEGETSGAFRVRKVGAQMIEVFPGDFGSYHRYNFSVGFALNLDEKVLTNELMVFPNPSSDKIRVELVGNVGSNAQAEIVDMNGRVVKRQSVNNNNQSYGVDFQVNDLQNGYYLVRISGSEGSETVPFIKQ